jgi:hypothetical protein
VKTQVDAKSKAGIPIASASQVESYAIQSGLSKSEAQSISEDYKSSQIASLRASMFLLVALAILTLALSRNIPDKKP